MILFDIVLFVNKYNFSLSLVQGRTNDFGGPGLTGVMGLSLIGRDKVLSVTQRANQRL